jgi:hypothetical protein
MTSRRNPPPANGQNGSSFPRAGCFQAAKRALEFTLQVRAVEGSPSLGGKSLVKLQALSRQIQIDTAMGIVVEDKRRPLPAGATALVNSDA